VDEYASYENYPKMIHILSEGLCHFVPIVCKTSVPNKPIEKQAHLSRTEGVQSKNNTTGGLTLHPDKSVAASQQQVCLLSHRHSVYIRGQRRMKVLLKQRYIKLQMVGISKSLA